MYYLQAEQSSCTITWASRTVAYKLTWRSTWYWDWGGSWQDSWNWVAVAIFRPKHIFK